MAYSKEMLTSATDCDLVLVMAADEKADLEFKKVTADRHTTIYTANAAEIDADLQTVNAEITVLETIIPNLPEGPAKAENSDKLVKANYKKFTLENRKESAGVIALLQSQLESERYALELAEVDAFIEEINTRKVSLEEAGK